MSTKTISEGLYAGIQYIVTEKDGKTYIGLQPENVPFFAGKGADLTILDDIGDRDPDDVMAQLFDSIPDDGKSQ